MDVVDKANAVFPVVRRLYRLANELTTIDDRHGYDETNQQLTRVSNQRPDTKY